MKQILYKLNQILTKKDRKQLFYLFLFSMFIAVVETVGISIIMPFISVASDFSLIESNQYYNKVYDFFNFNEKLTFVITFGVVLILFYIFRSAVNLLFTLVQSKFIYGRYAIIVYRLFENYLGMSYKNFVKKNSSTLTKAIINEAKGLVSIKRAFIIIVTELLVMISIYIMLLYVDVKITLIITFFLLFNAFLLTQTISKKIKNAGTIRAKTQKKFYEIINRSFSNFKFIKLQNQDKNIVNSFDLTSQEFAKSNIINGVYVQVPRLFLEAIGFSLIIAILISYLLINEENIKSILPMVSMFVLALYRLLPSVNRIMTGYNQIMFHHKSLDIVHNDLLYDSEALGNEKLEFQKYIELKNVSFKYDEKYVLKNINVHIQRNEKVAFIGESGSGKSTIIDLIMGLHKPCEGEIFIDNTLLQYSNVKDWRSKIGYIPQDVYLFDGTVSENIVFGREEDYEKVIEVLKKANIYNFLMDKSGIDTYVGEGGIALSGGQKQRIAIARALYDDPEILVLDEATSALDIETEESIMKEIYNISKHKTLLIIAHRLSTIEKCEKVIKLDRGCLIG